MKNRSLPIFVAGIAWFFLGLISGANGFALEAGLVIVWVSIFTAIIEREERRWRKNG